MKSNNEKESGTPAGVWVAGIFSGIMALVGGKFAGVAVGGALAEILGAGIGGGVTYFLVSLLFLRGNKDKNEWENMTEAELTKKWEICCATGDFAGADMWLKRAAEAGVADAQAELGARLMREADKESDLRGECVSKSPHMAEAMKWICRAAESGDKDSQTILDNIRQEAKRGDAVALAILPASAR